MFRNNVFKIRKNYVNFFINDLIKGKYFKFFEVCLYIDFFKVFLLVYLDCISV